MQSLGEFLAPVGSEVFLREIYSFHPAHIRGEAGRFRYLLSWDDINEILQSNRLAYPRLRLAMTGEILQKERYTIRTGGDSQLNIRSLVEHFRTGAMLVIDGIETLHQPIRALCRLLERELGDHVTANLYAGWHGTRGFDTHWDDHEVLIAQVDGAKRWRIFKPSRAHPLAEDRSLDETPPDDAPHWEGELQSGDVLHIPRGWWHDATPVEGERTMHLTLTIPRKTGLDLARTLTDRVRKVTALRADVPRFGTPELRHAYFEEFRGVAADWLKELTLEGYFEALDGSAATSLRPSLPWSATPAKEPIPQGAWIHWQPPRSVRLTEQGAKVTLTAMGVTYGFKRNAAPVLQNLAQERTVRFDQLCANHPCIPPNAVERFVMQLVANSLVSISERAAI